MTKFQHDFLSIFKSHDDVHDAMLGGQPIEPSNYY